jgi:hypothetical protein
VSVELRSHRGLYRDAGAPAGNAGTLARLAFGQTTEAYRSASTSSVGSHRNVGWLPFRRRPNWLGNSYVEYRVPTWRFGRSMDSRRSGYDAKSNFRAEIRKTPRPIWFGPCLDLMREEPVDAAGDRPQWEINSLAAWERRRSPDPLEVLAGATSSVPSWWCPFPNGPAGFVCISSLGTKSETCGGRIPDSQARQFSLCTQLIVCAMFTSSTERE